ncbi:MAG: hypothetical protein QOI15_2022, partial [Pseudonocardiales bacterium]|nr:hypothetical protein [Pseudonocardiales bacterium]
RNQRWDADFCLLIIERVGLVLGTAE